jgi:hypothetical protein
LGRSHYGGFWELLTASDAEHVKVLKLIKCSLPNQKQARNQTFSESHYELICTALGNFGALAEKLTCIVGWTDVVDET